MRKKRGMTMAYDREQVIAKLRQWESYSSRYRLPTWDEIPDLGLYMEQVTGLLLRYLNVPLPEDREEPVITATAINNYVRKKVMPKPVKKKYYRRHIAYLIIIYTLKHCLSIPTLQIMLPPDLTNEQMERVYAAYVARGRMAVGHFATYTQAAREEIEKGGAEAQSPEDFITTTAVLAGLSRTLAEQLLRLNDRAATSDETLAEDSADSQHQTK